MEARYLHLLAVTEDPIAAAILVHAEVLEDALGVQLPMGLLRGRAETRGDTLFVAEGLEEYLHGLRVAADAGVNSLAAVAGAVDAAALALAALNGLGYQVPSATAAQHAPGPPGVSVFGPAPPPLPKGAKLKALLDTPIEDLGWSVRATNTLTQSAGVGRRYGLGLTYLGELVVLGDCELLQQANCGRKTLDAIKESLAAMRLSLEMQPEDLGGWTVPSGVSVDYADMCIHCLCAVGRLPHRCPTTESTGPALRCARSSDSESLRSERAVLGAERAELLEARDSLELQRGFRSRSGDTDDDRAR